MKKRNLIGSCGAYSTLLTGCSRNEASSIGIIGGTDGPTAIYLTSSIVNYWSLLGVVVIGVIIATVIFFLKKRK